MSVQANKQLISGLVDEVWNQHDADTVGRYFAPASGRSPSTGGSCSPASPTCGSRWTAT